MGMAAELQTARKSEHLTEEHKCHVTWKARGHSFCLRLTLFEATR